MGLFGKRRGYEAPDYMTPGGGIGGDINRQQSESPLRDGGNWMRNLAMSLGAAQSFRDGDFNQGASLLDYVGQQGEAKRKAMQDEEQRRGLLQQIIAAGVPPEKAPLILAGVAKLGDVMPQAPELPTEARVAEWYRTATPEQRAAYDQTKPIVTQGYGSTVVPRSPLPTGGGGLTPMTPEEIRKLGLPEGGPSSPATGGFPRYRR